MTTPPKISVITPAYNAAQYIRATIDSVLSQTEQDFELLIINDGSTDDTEKIVREYDSPKIVYHTNPQNLGISKTYNRAMQLARGKYLAIAESDDISHPQRLEVQANFLRDHPNVGGVSARRHRFFGQPPKLDAIAGKVEAELSAPQARANAWLHDAIILHPVCMLRADVLRDNHFAYREDYSVSFDVKLFKQMSRVTDLIPLNCTLLAYRLHDSNNSRVYGKTGTIESFRAGIELMNDDSGANIDFAWFDGRYINSANHFCDLVDAIDVFVAEKIAAGTYDERILKQRTKQFLYRQLLKVTKIAASPREIYNCYRRAKLSREINLHDKARLFVKSLRSFT